MNNNVRAQGEWKEVIRAAPPERVAQAVTMAVSGALPQTSQEPQVVRPITRLAPQQQTSAIQMLITELENEGLERQAICEAAFVRELDPYRLSPQEINALVLWTAQQQPQVLARVVGRYQDQPEVLEGLLGEQVLRIVANSLSGATPQDGIHSTY